jgi:hypothetical protein
MSRNASLSRDEIAALTREEIVGAIMYHCHCMGSYPYYATDEVARFTRDPRCLVVFREEATGKLRAYTAQPRSYPEVQP